MNFGRRGGLRGLPNRMAQTGGLKGMLGRTGTRIRGAAGATAAKAKGVAQGVGGRMGITRKGLSQARTGAKNFATDAGRRAGEVTQNLGARARSAYNMRGGARGMAQDARSAVGRAATGVRDAAGRARTGLSKMRQNLNQRFGRNVTTSGDDLVKGMRPGESVNMMNRRLAKRPQPGVVGPGQGTPMPKTTGGRAPRAGAGQEATVSMQQSPFGNQGGIGSFDAKTWRANSTVRGGGDVGAKTKQVANQPAAAGAATEPFPALPAGSVPQGQLPAGSLPQLKSSVPGAGAGANVTGAGADAAGGWQKYINMENAKRYGVPALVGAGAMSMLGNRQAPVQQYYQS